MYFAIFGVSLMANQITKKAGNQFDTKCTGPFLEKEKIENLIELFLTEVRFLIYFKLI